MATKKRTPAKRSGSASKRTKSTKAQEMPSFRIVKDTIPFTSTKFTRQTFYWIVLLGFIVISQLWIIKLQMDIAELTNALTLIR